MVRSGEGPLTHPASEGPVPRVFPRVTGQLIRPGKLPSTALVLAQIRFLPGVSPQMGLEVTGLGVSLWAALIGTGVDDGLPLGVVTLSLWLCSLLGSLCGGTSSCIGESCWGHQRRQTVSTGIELLLEKLFW